MTDRSKVAKAAKPWGDMTSGYFAFTLYRSPCSCPHALGTISWSAWYAGWLLALDERNFINAI